MMWLSAAALILSCGGGAGLDAQVGETRRRAVTVSEWPLPVAAPAEALSVQTALGATDGAQIRVRGYLVALSPACPACTVVGAHGRSTPEEDRIGKTARPRGPEVPGCPPCPPAGVIFSDEPAGASASRSPASAVVRAVGSAEGLQARHLGRPFLLTGTFHARGAGGPELDVSDVRAVEGP